MASLVSTIVYLIPQKSRERRQSFQSRERRQSFQLIPFPALCSCTSFTISGITIRHKPSAKIFVQKLGVRCAVTSTSSTLIREQLLGAKEEIIQIIEKSYANPILIRLGWHDAGTYDKDVKEWPKCGGANGSLRYAAELNHAANAGLHNAVKLLEPVKQKFPLVSYADLFQLASATAVEMSGGPRILMRYGREDATSSEDCVEEGRLPDAGPPDPAEHLRKVFYRMGLSDKEIVALSGAHTLGRARPERSGWGKAETNYTKDGPGTPGGQSWTTQWLKFDNSYFKEIKEKKNMDLLVLPTDAILFEDPGFKPYAETYAASQETFFQNYAEAHKRLSELGSRFEPPEGIVIDSPGKDAVPEKFVAAKYSAGQQKKDLSKEMKAKIRSEYLAIGGSPDQPLKSNYFLNIILVIAVLAILASLVSS